MHTSGRPLSPQPQMPATILDLFGQVEAQQLKIQVSAKYVSRALVPTVQEVVALAKQDSPCLSRWWAVGLQV